MREMVSTRARYSPARRFNLVLRCGATPDEHLSRGRCIRRVVGPPTRRTVTGLYDLEGVLGPSVIGFVEHHVSSLLAWDVIVFFHRNPEAALDSESLAGRLGRRVEEIEPEIAAMCRGHILHCGDGVIRYRPTDEIRSDVSEFVDSCQDRDRRLALIALVLHRIAKPPRDA